MLPISAVVQVEGLHCGREMCLGCELVIFHFPGSSSQTCSNGEAVAFLKGVVDNCYTSQLTVTVNANMNNTSVICAYDNGTRMVVGNETLKLTSGIIV